MEVILSDKPVASAALDHAISRALLERVAAGELEGAVRIWQPVPALAFGRLDLREPGARAALEVAAREGIEAVRRLSGGHVVLLGEGSFCVGIAERSESFAGSDERYMRLGGAIEAALADLGIESEHGELDGEWCPGAWSLKSGSTKLAGLAQRAIQGAAWIEAVVARAPLPRESEILAAVYEALALPFDPATLGSLESVRGAVRFTELAVPLRDRLAPDLAASHDPDPTTHARAGSLAPGFELPE